MKFAAITVALIPFIGASLALEPLPALTLAGESPSNRIAGDGSVNAAAVCRPANPKYCSKYNFCCPSSSIGCCPKACCARGATYCGTDGHCYGPA